MSPINLGVPVNSATGGDDISSQDYGTTNHPFTTARADLDGTITSNVYPYRASGKLFFNIDVRSILMVTAWASHG
jgi:hypothetical protein